MNFYIKNKFMHELPTEKSSQELSQRQQKPFLRASKVDGLLPIKHSSTCSLFQSKSWFKFIVNVFKFLGKKSQNLRNMVVKNNTGM